MDGFRRQVAALENQKYVRPTERQLAGNYNGMKKQATEASLQRAVDKENEAAKAVKQKQFEDKVAWNLMKARLRAQEEDREVDYSEFEGVKNPTLFREPSPSRSSSRLPSPPAGLFPSRQA
jgi:hypothetical protein